MRKVLRQSGGQSEGSRGVAPKGQWVQSGNGGEGREIGELRRERIAEKGAAGDGERAVAEAVIAAGEGQHAALFRRQPRRFQRGFDRLAAGVGQDGLARPELPRLEGELRELAAELDFFRVGCTSPMA